MNFQELQHRANEIDVVIKTLHAGIAARGIDLFNDNGAAILQNAINDLMVELDDIRKSTAELRSEDAKNPASDET